MLGSSYEVIHKGCKSKNPTRTFNLGVNHRRRILATTKGHPGAWSDKTLVLFDEFLTKVKSGETLKDVEFELLEEFGGVVRAVTYHGVWTVVDNGYLLWAMYTHRTGRRFGGRNGLNPCERMSNVLSGS
jgi:hypothetical protein